MLYLALSSVVLNPAIELFARSGGGGSSSGGGGGGIEILFGYLPMHFVGSLLRKKLKLPPIVASFTGWSIALLYIIVWIVLAGWYGAIIGLAAGIGMAAGLYNWLGKATKLAKKAKQAQALAVQTDSAWGIENLNAQTTQTFGAYQNSWSNNDVASMAGFLSPYYLRHNQLMILALQQLGRRNLMANYKITQLDLVDVTDVEDKTQDRFVMLVSATADDQLVDTKTNTIIFTDKKPFQEYWKFIRQDDSHWLLEGIGQVTEDPYMRNNVLAQFAASHNYFFSADWGWLLLPSRGQLFNKGKFGTSDINNHVIGVYNNVLIQLYNYVPNPTSAPTDTHIIAQVALPKTYGNIVVRRKSAFSGVGIKGLTKISLEWGEFNKMYDVWASDMERVTSFELLHPAYMAKLRDLPFEVNIEVVDNIVYLYSRKAKATPEIYESMLALLNEAFKEMRM